MLSCCGDVELWLFVRARARLFVRALDTVFIYYIFIA